MHFQLSINVDNLQEVEDIVQRPLYLQQIEYLNVTQNQNDKSFSFKDGPNHHEVVSTTFDHISNILHAVDSPVNECTVYDFGQYPVHRDVSKEQCLKPSKLRKTNGDSLKSLKKRPWKKNISPFELSQYI
eukprot:627251_1